MTTPDPAQEFRDTLILGQGLIEGIDLEMTRICLRFNFPRHFEILFMEVADYRAKLPLDIWFPVREWRAFRDSEYLKDMPERLQHRHRNLSPRGDPDRLCHFHMSFPDGYLDVLAEDFAFTIVSK